MDKFLIDPKDIIEETSNEINYFMIPLVLFSFYFLYIFYNSMNKDMRTNGFFSSIYTRYFSFKDSIINNINNWKTKINEIVINPNKINTKIKNGILHTTRYNYIINV